jgi:beta-alanine degradation protein BauB
MTSRDKPGPNVGTRVIEEHDRVKVWELVLEPGESSEWHRHEHDYIFVVLEPAPLRTDYDDGTSRVYPSHVGEVLYTPPSTHRVTNVGQTRYRNVIIELKDVPRRTADGPHHAARHKPPARRRD